MQHKDGGYERDRAGRNVFDVDVAEVLSFVKMAEMFAVKTISASLQPCGDRQRQATASTAASPHVQLFPRLIRIRIHFRTCTITSILPSFSTLVSTSERAFSHACLSRAPWHVLGPTFSSSLSPQRP